MINLIVALSGILVSVALLRLRDEYDIGNMCFTLTYAISMLATGYAAGRLGLIDTGKISRAVYVWRSERRLRKQGKGKKLALKIDRPD